MLELHLAHPPVIRLSGSVHLSVLSSTLSSTLSIVFALAGSSLSALGGGVKSRPDVVDGVFAILPVLVSLVVSSSTPVTSASSVGFAQNLLIKLVGVDLDPVVERELDEELPHAVFAFEGSKEPLLIGLDSLYDRVQREYAPCYSGGHARAVLFHSKSVFVELFESFEFLLLAGEWFQDESSRARFAIGFAVDTHDCLPLVSRLELLASQVFGRELSGALWVLHSDGKCAERVRFEVGVIPSSLASEVALLVNVSTSLLHPAAGSSRPSRLSASKPPSGRPPS